MLGNHVKVVLADPPEDVKGVLQKQDELGVWVYWGWAEKAALHFYPAHRVREIIDEGRVIR